MERVATGTPESDTTVQPEIPSTPSRGSLRQRVDRWVESTLVQRFVVAVILANAVILGLETTAWGHETAGTWLSWLDKACLAVFVVEITAKLIGKGFGFFRSGWNVFDLLVVAIALVPSTGGFAVLRTLRVLRLVSLVKRLRFVVEALVGAVSGIMSIGALLVLIFYVGSVMATSLFSETFPEWFGSIASSAYSLFQIMTLESWSMGIVRPVMEVHPWAWAFFVPFIVLSAFAVLNLFVAVIVDSMQNLRENPEAWPDRPEGEKESQDEIAALRAQVSSLQRDMSETLALLRKK
ncbi:voltage-gated sodium channel [Micrococcales bacterium KH10]|nr:voltage-gated sodium channel [Micrococcales bacterium KH10]